MRGSDFLDKIELVDAAFVEEADRNHGTAEQTYRKRGKTMIRRMTALAAVIALMLCSGVVGALAFSKETVVEVPVKQETIALEKIGLTVILPDEWEEKYGVELDEDGNGCAVYVKSIHDGNGEWAGQGYLFWIGAVYDAPLTPEELYDWSPVPCVYLFATADRTYALNKASDVQFDPSDPEQTDLYTTMARQINEIAFLVNNPASID